MDTGNRILQSKQIEGARWPETSLCRFILNVMAARTTRISKIRHSSVVATKSSKQTAAESISSQTLSAAVNFQRPVVPHCPHCANHNTYGKNVQAYGEAVFLD